MAYVLYTSYVPFPPYPDNIVAWMFLAIMVAGGVTYAVLRGHPQILDRIGRSVADDTALATATVPVPPERSRTRRWRRDQPTVTAPR